MKKYIIDTGTPKSMTSSQLVGLIIDDCAWGINPVIDELLNNHDLRYKVSNMTVILALTFCDELLTTVEQQVKTMDMLDNPLDYI